MFYLMKKKICVEPVLLYFKKYISIPPVLFLDIFGMQEQTAGFLSCSINNTQMLKKKQKKIQKKL